MSTASAAGIPSIPGIDTRQVEALLGKEPAMFLELLRAFFEEFGSAPQRIKAALDAGDRIGAAASLHKLRGTASYLGATEIVGSARQLEDGVKANAGDIAGLYARFAASHATLLEGARPWLAPAAS